MTRPVACAVYDDVEDGANPWSRAARAATWQDITRGLPPNIGLEFTADHGWRLIHLSVEARRALELLDIYEGDVVPDDVRRQRARQRAVAEDMLAQVRAVLRAVDEGQRLPRPRLEIVDDRSA